MSMRSGPHIGDILVTRIIMVRPAALRQNVRFTTRSCTRHARSPQRVARGQTLKPEIQWGNAKSTKPCHQNYNGGTHRAHQKCTFHHTFARSTRTISAEGCSRTNAIRVSPHARAIDGHDSTRGLRFVRPARTALHQKEFTAETVYTRQRLHQTPYTPDTVYTRRRLHQTKPTKVYTRKSLHHRQFTPDSVYTRHRLHQTWFTPDMVETIAAAIIRRLATKDCKTPRNYALNDDTGTPSSQNYKANSNQSV